jgi:uncharacterized protein YPO0396
MNERNPSRLTGYKCVKSTVQEYIKAQYIDAQAGNNVVAFRFNFKMSRNEQNLVAMPEVAHSNHQPKMQQPQARQDINAAKDFPENGGRGEEKSEDWFR